MKHVSESSQRRVRVESGVESDRNTPDWTLGASIAVHSYLMQTGKPARQVVYSILATFISDQRPLTGNDRVSDGTARMQVLCQQRYYRNGIMAEMERIFKTNMSARLVAF